MSILSQEEKDRIVAEFVSCLPALRARLRMTQEDLAARVGTTRQTIIAIESGKRPLTWSMFLSILFIFFMNPATRTLLIAGNVLTEENCRAIFGDSTFFKKM